MNACFKPNFLTALVFFISFLSAANAGEARSVAKSDLILEDQFQLLATDSFKDIRSIVQAAPPLGCTLNPAANAGKNRSATVGMPISLDGSRSTDPGCGVEYFWTVVGRPQGSPIELFNQYSTSPTFIADRAGTYEIELTVFRPSPVGVFTDQDTVTIIATGSLGSEAKIGSNGGAVGLPDGSSVLIPPGALRSEETISIETTSFLQGAIFPPTTVLVSDVYELAPTGQTFSTPIQINIPYDTAMLPPDYSEGAINIYRQGDWPEFNMVGNDANDDPEPSNNGQIIDLPSDMISVFSSRFSAYAALAVRSSSQFTPVTLTEPTASIVVRRPPNLRITRPQHHNCTPNNAQSNIGNRIGPVEAVIIHSTNNGNSSRDFESELGWAADDCNRYFTHYYIDRDGEIYQVVDDLLVTFHTGSTSFGMNNGNAIGIELFLSVGEPYDGRQVSSLIRLIDFLAERHQIPRPLRDPATGTFIRNRTNIAFGGDRFIGHTEHDAAKCDPSGTFMDSGFIKPEQAGIPCLHPADPRVQRQLLPGGSSQASALMDMLMDALVVLGRDRQHTGIINTHGGDALELGTAGHGGDVTFREDAALIGSAVGTHELTEWQQNDPQQLGPGPLIVAPGETENLGAGTHEYTDVIIDGTLNISGTSEFRLTGSFYLSPTGQIVTRDGFNGGSVTVYSRGTPIIQGLIDARGDDGVSGATSGGNGGSIEFVYAAPGLVLIPTAYTRGGDADYADTSLAGGGPRGGNGGAVTIEVETSHIFLGGGVGPVISGAAVPPWRSGPIDPALLDPGRWAGDFLPPPPPFTRSSIGVNNPAAGERVRKWTTALQPGFRRGILTAGGMGGWGQSAPPRHGGPAGDGGNIQVSLDSNARLTLRDIDIATGTEIETLRHRFFVAGDPQSQVVCTAGGAHGGLGSSNGNGGTGGNAGSFSLIGGVLNPAPSQFVDIHEIRGFPPGDPMQQGDDSCSSGRITVGRAIEARDAGGAPLYRVRLSGSGTHLLGGLGGIPSQAGVVGALGTSGAISGLPVQ